MPFQNFKREAVAVAETLTTLLSMDVREFRKVGLSVTPSDYAFDQFTVGVKYHPEGPTITIASASGAYTSPTDRILDASGDLTALTAAAVGWLEVDVEGISTLIIQAASSNAAGSPTDVYAHAQ